MLSQLLKNKPGHALLIFFPQIRTYVSLLESVNRLVSAKLWNFLEARVLYDECVEN